MLMGNVYYSKRMLKKNRYPLILRSSFRSHVEPSNSWLYQYHSTGPDTTKKYRLLINLLFKLIGMGYELIDALEKMFNKSGAVRIYIDIKKLPPNFSIDLASFSN
ncbi:Uncharacterised protein [Bacillus freudenreichii]|nr:Uncharacterised protein [Bacillus freudenreichii]